MICRYSVAREQHRRRDRVGRFCVARLAWTAGDRRLQHYRPRVGPSRSIGRGGGTAAPRYPGSCLDARSSTARVAASPAAEVSSLVRFERALPGTRSARPSRVP
jgi:hypothetical protein